MFQTEGETLQALRRDCIWYMQSRLIRQDLDTHLFVTDLMDTLRENREICVGMAANMIGVNKSIIVMVQKILYVYRFASLVYHKGFFSNDILKNYILLNISLDHQSLKK